MKFELEDQGSYRVLRCLGVMDSGMRQYSNDIIHPLVEQPKSKILVDLSGVNRITSEGIGVFVTLVARANTKGSRVVFVCPSPFVDAVFSATKIDRFLETEPTLEAGLKRLLGETPESDPRGPR